MVVRRALVIAMAVWSAASASAQLQTWAVKEEQELRPGYYTKILAKKQGWVTFQVESREGITCYTAKPQEGEDLPPPFKDSLLARDKALLQITLDPVDNEKLLWSIDGPHTGEAQYRVPGDRFMETIDGLGVEDFSKDGAVIEFRWEGWRYPRIYEGHAVVEGRFDLTGLQRAAIRHRKLCGAA